jgi:TonB family protein
MTASEDGGDRFTMPITLIQALWFSWLAGFVIVASVLMSGLIRLAWLALHSRPVRHGRCLTMAAEMSAELGLRRPVQLLETEHPALLLTWGMFRPKILLPRAAREWSESLCRVVLSHEFAHIRRNDWFVQLLAEFIRCVYWFNPLAWLAASRLRQDSEQACDDAVIGGGVAGSDYAGHLLHLARAARASSPIWLPAPAMARLSSLERRIGAMLDDGISRRSISTTTRLTAASAVVTVTVLLAGVAVIAQSFATLSGSVIDPTNRILPNATLLLTNAQTQSKYEVRSDSTGRFEFVGLPAGRYILEATQPGFASFKWEMTISGQRLQKDIALEVGSLQETITVMARPRAVTATPPPPRPAPRLAAGRTAEKCMPSAVGGNLVPPAKHVDVKPVYPGDLAQASVGGVVILDARIQPEGDVGEVSVLTSAHPALDAAAIDAVRQWRFTPTLLNCEPIEVKMNVKVSFRAQ